jgi:orotate phosphoribosyltransferase
MRQQTEWLRDFIEHKAVFRSGEMPLSRGWHRKLAVLLSGGRASPEFQHRMAALFWLRLRSPKARPFQICACETGGVPVACALQAAAYAAQAVPVFAVKTRPKDYGLKNWIEGVVDPRLPVLLVDDVVGGQRTLTQAAERLRSFGLEVQGAFAIAAVKDGPLTFKLAGEDRPITVLLGSDAFARTYEQYFAKYGKLPKFEGVLA